MTFTDHVDQLPHRRPVDYTVAAGREVSDYFNAVAYDNGWYDFTVTVSSDTAWSRRFTGHLETGAPSVTG